MKLFARYPECREVIVNRSGEPTSAVRGILWQQRGPYLVLRQAVLLEAGGKSTPLAGEVAIPRQRIDFLQVL
jgi:hypothetical protein